MPWWRQSRPDPLLAGAISAAARLVLVAAAVRWCHGATEGAGELHPAQITVLIQNTRKIPELVKLDAAKGHMFNAIHLSVYWNRVKMLAGTPRSLERRALYRHAEALRPACDRTRAAVLGPHERRSLGRYVYPDSKIKRADAHQKRTIPAFRRDGCPVKGHFAAQHHQYQQR